MHMHSKKDAVDGKRIKRINTPSSPSSSSSSLQDSSPTPLPSKDVKDNSFPRRVKKWKKTNTYTVHGWLCKYHKFKEGGKSITFLTYDGTFGATDKILTSIQ